MSHAVTPSSLQALSDDDYSDEEAVGGGDNMREVPITAGSEDSDSEEDAGESDVVRFEMERGGTTVSSLNEEFAVPPNCKDTWADELDGE